MESSDGLQHGLLQIAGPNRPGMVSETAQYTLKCQGNIIGCQATRLGSQLFTANILLSATPENFNRIESGLGVIKGHQPRLLRVPAQAQETADAPLAYELSVMAFDKEGIVAEVAQILATENLDIMQLSCASYTAPFGGQPMFALELIAEAPDHVAANKAKAMLELLAPSRSWDIHWKSVKPGARIGMPLSKEV